MPSDCISFKETNYFSDLICDYLDEKSELDMLYNRFPKMENFSAQIKEKSESFQNENRQILERVLLKQYHDSDASLLTHEHITSLSNSNTFTITTGHQLNLFTGPLYFLFKIISVINLTKQLKAKYSNYNFVPVYWMATEDHDFEEINYFNFKGKKVTWSRNSGGAVGHFETSGLDEVAKVFASQLGQTENAKQLVSLFKKAYYEHENLADATRFLANALFGHYGLVIIDADDPELKKVFGPFMKRELMESVAHRQVLDTNSKIEKLNYKVQVSPRAINLFYLSESQRERIVKEGEHYRVLNTSTVWNKEELLDLLQNHPERFSPNVIMRPLYQEVILPNLCYIGGGGELAYWLQLKSFFDAEQVPFPMLLLRNSALLISEKQLARMEKLHLTLSDLFLDQEQLIKVQTKKLSDFKIDFDDQKAHLKKQFEALYQLAEKTDKSFIGAVGAQERKQIKGLEHLEKRLLKAQKRKLSEQLDRVKSLHYELFPNGSLQERQTNFSEFYLEHGESLIPKLMEELEPLKGEFLIIEL
ncbi:MAG: bacillithiol biosynthesis cysteine-adding enzyme BshC [Bacteroidia bacterium]|nr:bacillithiol biosynthesis cysteine-adding enzyme BshC [Bacteroidia bacterium]NNK60477.1 bacillithiol biosynthesis cysteine-adding enzyme BshC [Flavobacteriaceae bacterium]